MKTFTRKFIRNQSDEWLNNFYNDYVEANQHKQKFLKKNFDLVKKELDRRYEIEKAQLYKAESTAEFGQIAMERLDGAYDVEDVGCPHDYAERYLN